MHTEIIHHLDSTYPGGVSKTVKQVKLFGIVISKKTYHYPKLKHYDVIVNF